MNRQPTLGREDGEEDFLSWQCIDGEEALLMRTQDFMS